MRLQSLISGLLPEQQIHSGAKSIKGQVKKVGISIPCRVWLFHLKTSKLIDHVLTDNNGFYEFKNLRETEYFVLVHDPAKQYNAVIQDMVVPK